MPVAEAREVDVVVVGGGQAGLAAAITAAEAGARVLLLEKSPRSRRGGNSRHTRNLRPLHNAAQPPLEGAYDYREYADDLARVTAGFTDEPLAELTLRESADCVDWLQERGVAFQKPLTGTLHLARTNAFFLGGGKAMMNALYRHAEHLGIEILYAVEDVQLDCHHGDFKGLSFQLWGTVYEVQARSLVAAAGGFEANHEWLADGWGEAAENFLVRGTPDNQGEILAQLLAAGCESVGDVSQCHAVAIDGRSPRFDGGICTRVDAVPFGIVVNREGVRFYDEGEDFWPKRYAIWGRLIAKQPGQVAYSIIDSQSHDLFMPTVYPALEADSIGELAELLGLPVSEMEATVAQFNHAVRRAEFNAEVLDDCRTEGLAVEKSHWARPLIMPPYRAWPLRPGITFTYMGVKVDEKARVQWHAGKTSQNIFAAGEIMAGNILGQGYLAGIGITIGNVFGRIAGREAALYAA